MHSFNYEIISQRYLTPEIVSLIAKIHEYKGRQDLFIEANKDELNSLLKVARIQSTGSSNRIEGIFTTDKRLKELVQEKVAPQNRSEQEISGYRDVLNTIHENYNYIIVKPTILLQLHRDLYSYSNASVGGKFKSVDNVIAEVDSYGNKYTRFIPTPAFQTPKAVEEMCEKLHTSQMTDKIDNLILIPMFVFDFLCIHPFNDGNGRLSRLLTLLLFYKAGYIVGKYVSFERLIEKSKTEYYESLQASSFEWHENKNNYVPFIKYYLGILLKAYEEFENRIEHLRYQKISKSKRIQSFIDKKIGKVTKKEIMEYYPDISKITVERTLNNLVKIGYIKKIGSGRITAYVKN